MRPYTCINVTYVARILFLWGWVWGVRALAGRLPVVTEVDGVHTAIIVRPSVKVAAQTLYAVTPLGVQIDQHTRAWLV